MRELVKSSGQQQHASQQPRDVNIKKVGQMPTTPKRALRERRVDAMPNAVRRERAQQSGCFYAYMRLLKVNALPVAAAGSAFAKSSRAVCTVSCCMWKRWRCSVGISIEVERCEAYLLVNRSPQ
jgi:hypothetical protein